MNTGRYEGIIELSYGNEIISLTEVTKGQSTCVNAVLTVLHACEERAMVGMRSMTVHNTVSQDILWHCVVSGRDILQLMGFNVDRRCDVLTITWDWNDEI